MFILEKVGFLPSIFIDLKDDVRLCTSCIFGIARKSQWMKKKVFKSKETNNNPQAGVSVDQIQSAHPGLVPQFSGKLTSARTWSAQTMVDYFIYITYVHPMKSTSQ